MPKGSKGEEKSIENMESLSEEEMNEETLPEGEEVYEETDETNGEAESEETEAEDAGEETPDEEPERPRSRRMRSGKTLLDEEDSDEEDIEDEEDVDYEEDPEDYPDEDEEAALEELERARKKEAAEIRKKEEAARKKLEAAQRKEEAARIKQAEKEKKKAEKEKIKQTPEYKRRMKKIRIISGAVILAVLIFAAVFLIKRYVRFSGYNVTANVEMTNVDEHTQVYRYHGGFVKCAGDGVTYFDKGGINWSESFAMADPLCDVCGDYIAVVDMKSTEVYLYGTHGFIKKISLTRVATDIEVSKYGSIAVATNEGEANYIEIKDKDGKEIVNVKTVFSSTGYLSDISMTSDGSRLAASYISVTDSNIRSKVIFYDFSRNEKQGEDPVVGEFDHYDDTVLTGVEYVNDNRLVAVGDNAFTIYSASGNPGIAYEEREIPWQIQSFFMSDKYIGFIVENTEDENAYAIKAYNMGGKMVCDERFDFAYNHVAFAGSNIVLNTEYDCDVINFAGTHKFAGTFDNRIYYLMPYDDGVNFILLNSGHTQFIKLR